ncbi:GTP cyclohydrolase I [Nocardia takedensis]
MPGHSLATAEEITDRQRVAHDLGDRDLTAARSAAAAFLTALGMDLTSPERADTPMRMAHAYAELLTPRPFELAVFDNTDGYNQLVVVRDIKFASVCEHHALPFFGAAHVGYVPGARVAGLSKLARVVELFARRPQTQEAMTQQIATWLETNLDPSGVGVVVVAEHLCMSMRGAQAVGAVTETSAVRGALADDSAVRGEFFARVGPTGRVGGK